MPPVRRERPRAQAVSWSRRRWCRAEQVSWQVQQATTATDGSPARPMRQSHRRPSLERTLPAYVDTGCFIAALLDRAHQPTGGFTDFVRAHKAEFPRNFAGCIALVCEGAALDPTLGSPSYRIWERLKDDESVWLAMGIQPADAEHFFVPGMRERLSTALSEAPRVVAVGLIGLDYSIKDAESLSSELRKAQQDAFAMQLADARGEHPDKALILACLGGADDDFLHTVSQAIPAPAQREDVRIALHTDSPEVMLKMLAAFPQLFVCFCGSVTFRRAKRLQEMVWDCPLNRILLYSSAPYHLPRDSAEKDQGHREESFCHPGHLLPIAVAVANLSNGHSLLDLFTATLENTQKCFGITVLGPTINSSSSSGGDSVDSSASETEE
eukprot:m.264147 g.264147  ORF g.264147 m.264147 type:complete len:383 (-) comp11053_c2_seq16:1321-2469(-)